MDSKSIRYRNARVLVEQIGGISNFADKINKGQSQTSQFAGTNPIKGIGNKVAREIEDAFEKPHGWLDIPHEDTKKNNNLDNQHQITTSPIPVISWRDANTFTNIEKILHDVEINEWLPPTKDSTNNSYGLIVTGLSMSPKFQPEDRIYVNPDFSMNLLKTGDFVIVSCADELEATFKQLVIEGSIKYLQPHNPNWDEKIIKLTNDCQIIGKVVGLYRKV